MSGRILYLALEAPREGQASFVHISEIIAGLRRRGWSVDLVAPAYSTRWVRPPLSGRLLEYLRIQAIALLRLRRADILYVRSHFIALPLVFAAWIMGRPIVQEVNGPYEDVFVTYPGARGFRGLLVWMQRVQYRVSAGLIAVTPQLADWLRVEAKDRPVAVIPNGANTVLFHPSAETSRKLPKPYAVFVGGLTRWHGVPTMMAAAQRKEWPAGVHLVIVGDGQERPVVDQAAALCPHILCLGRVPYADVGGIIAGALCALAPISDPGGRSKTGLAPIKVFEALACATPVVGSDLSGLADLIRTYRCGKVVSPDHPAELAGAVAWMAASPDQASEMGLRGHKMVVENASWDQRAAETERFLQGLMARDGGGPL